MLRQDQIYKLLVFIVSKVLKKLNYQQKNGFYFIFFVNQVFCNKNDLKIIETVLFINNSSGFFQIFKETGI
jgi:hypothetical protein